MQSTQEALEEYREYYAFQVGDNMKCKICKKTTRTLAAMATHYRKAHPKKMKAKATKKSIAVPCTWCGEYIPKNKLKQHMKEDHTDDEE